MPKSARILIPAAALSMCLLTGCSGTSTSTAPIAAGSPTSSTTVFASAAPTNSRLVPSASTGAPVDSGAGLTAAAATADRPAGFALPNTLTPVAVSSGGVLIVAGLADQNHNRLTAYDKAGKLVWTSGDTTIIAQTVFVAGTKVRALGLATHPASGLNASENATYTMTTFDLTKPNDPGIIIPTTQKYADNNTDGTVDPKQSAQYNAPSAIVGTVEYFPSDGFSIDLSNGKVTQFDESQGIVIGADSTGALIKVTADPDATCGISNCAAILGTPTWHVKAGAQLLTQGNTPTKPVKIDSHGNIGVSQDSTPPAWVTRDGKTLIKAGGDVMVYSTNGKWEASGATAINTQTGKTYTFPTSAGQTDPTYLAIDNQGQALTVGADLTSVVQVNVVTNATKILSPKASFDAVLTFGGWTVYTPANVSYNEVLGPNVIVPSP